MVRCPVVSTYAPNGTWARGSNPTRVIGAPRRVSRSETAAVRSIPGATPSVVRATDGLAASRAATSAGKNPPPAVTVRSTDPQPRTARSAEVASTESAATSAAVIAAVPTIRPATTSRACPWRRVASRTASLPRYRRRPAKIATAPNPTANSPAAASTTGLIGPSPRLPGQLLPVPRSRRRTAPARTAPVPGPVSSICPSRIRTARPAAAAISGSWVTMTIVWPSSFSCLNSAVTAAVDSESRFPVGSSAHTTAGRCTSARATATRCCSPPDSWPGRCRARSASPTRASVSRVLARTCLPRTPASSSGSSTFSAALSTGSR